MLFTCALSPVSERDAQLHKQRISMWWTVSILWWLGTNKWMCERHWFHAKRTFADFVDYRASRNIICMNRSRLKHNTDSLKPYITSHRSFGDILHPVIVLEEKHMQHLLTSLKPHIVGSSAAFPVAISTCLVVLTSCQATYNSGCMLCAKWLEWSQTVIVTKFPLRAFSPLPNRVLPQFRAVTIKAYLSEPQASKQPSNQTGVND